METLGTIWVEGHWFRFPAFMVIPQPSFPNRRSLEGAKDPSILCAAPGEKNLKMRNLSKMKTRKTFVLKQMCVTRMMFFQLGSLVYEYYFQVALSRLSLWGLAHSNYWFLSPMPETSSKQRVCKNTNINHHVWVRRCLPHLQDGTYKVI